MKKSAKTIFFIFLAASLCLYFTGCANSGVSPENEEDISDLFEGNPLGAGGAFYFGVVSPDNEMQPYAYTGEEMRIPYRVTGMDAEVRSDFGMLVFVDGLPQPYRMEKKNGEVSEEKYMQKFYLENEEAEEFDIVFTPVTGKAGDRVGIIFSTIFQPDYLPQSAENPSYGFYHSVSANLPQEVYFQNGTTSEKEQISNLEVLVEDIPQEILDRMEIFTTVDGLHPLDENTRTELLAEDGDKDIFYAENDKVKLMFRIYGGLEMLTFRTTIFINHNPVRIMDADYIETVTKKGKMSTVEFELDVSDYGELNTIYAISNPAGRDYLAPINFPIKTDSILLVNP